MFRSFRSCGADVYFALFLSVENMFITYLFILVIFWFVEYVIKKKQFFLINNLFITIAGSLQP